jgi:hypothetical protein
VALEIERTGRRRRGRRHQLGAQLDPVAGPQDRLGPDQSDTNALRRRRQAADAQPIE